MSELPHLGKRCCFPECRQLDFLPVKCRCCEKDFCKEHYFTDSHRCEKAGEEGSGGRRPDLAREDAGEGSFACSIPDCRRRELVEMGCAGCGRHFCLAHRHGRDHSCAKLEEEEDIRRRQLEMPATKEMVARITSSSCDSQPKKLRSAKSRKTAAKVQLMKLKLKSKGNSGLPQDERVYLKVFPPMTKHGSKPPCGVFVSQSWSLGRVVDAAAELSGVDNRNNVADADKLSLFRHADGKDLCGLKGVGAELRELLDSEELFNGDVVVLEFVSKDDNSSPRFIDTSQYLDK